MVEDVGIEGFWRRGTHQYAALAKRYSVAQHVGDFGRVIDAMRDW